MSLRDMVTNLIFFVLALIHFTLQWYAWKLHVAQVTPSGDWLGASPDQLWNISSFPLFLVVPRRLQNLHFFEILIANSALWGAALSWGVALPLRLLGAGGRRPPRGVTTAVPAEVSQGAPRTGTDRLVELKRLLDEGLITREEYQRKRTTILLKI